jgi:hypothetical protein
MLDGAQASDGQAFWRARAEQLEHALTSRIVIEQAKGVLAERLGVDMEGAFELLRYAARSTQAKLQDLAREVVTAEETPSPIVEALKRHETLLARGPRANRPIQTQRFVQAVNDEIRRNDGVAPVAFLCECGNAACAETILLDSELLVRLHAESNLFVVAPGHEIADVETVVAESDGYLIVRKN